MVRTETVVCLACGGPAARGERVCPWCNAGIVEVRAAVPGGLPAVSVPARKTYCPHCTRLYAEGEATCPRCRPATVPVKPEAFWGANAVREPKGARCPACSMALVEGAMGAVTVDRCEGCGGTWFDVGELARVVDLSTWGAAADRVELLEREAREAAPERDGRRTFACVRCRARMFRRLVAPRAPVHVDLCARHGVWFDAGELEAFRAFVGGGGLEIARRRSEQPPPRRRRPFPLLANERPLSLVSVLGAIVGSSIFRA